MGTGWSTNGHWFKTPYRLTKKLVVWTGIWKAVNTSCSSSNSSLFLLCHPFLCFICFFMSFIAGFLKPQCSLAPPMQRGRSGEACSCFTGMCHLHQRRISSGNTDRRKHNSCYLSIVFVLRCNLWKMHLSYKMLFLKEQLMT